MRRLIRPGKSRGLAHNQMQQPPAALHQGLCLCPRATLRQGTGAYRIQGISKMQVRAGRTRGNQLTPEEEHQQRAAGKEPQIKASPGPINLDKDAMHTLMDWVWKNFTNKHQARRNGNTRLGWQMMA